VWQEGIRCVGPNSFGLLGVGSTRDDLGDVLPLTDVPVLAFSDEVRDLAIGSAHICAALTSGDVVCWGSGQDGALGNQSSDAVGDDEVPTSALAIPIF
jgi:alpha-tubulin suppressor-like RCC1 family protein